MTTQLDQGVGRAVTDVVVFGRALGAPTEFTLRRHLFPDPTE